MTHTSKHYLCLVAFLVFSLVVQAANPAIITLKPKDMKAHDFVEFRFGGLENEIVHQVDFEVHGADPNVMFEVVRWKNVVSGKEGNQTLQAGKAGAIPAARLLGTELGTNSYTGQSRRTYSIESATPEWRDPRPYCRGCMAGQCGGPSVAVQMDHGGYVGTVGSPT
ncbi:uncharacterized protein MKK02DRAFT_32104 [Dioszegia hungarica]|uniref:Uncharacterized protein n=1 Tax=Dioszegia hungarica TaxID=4972 RepID=A0AA38HAG6_9TREE|nr:uncharacterized protein MKK02DRAFT_32104 [Dioszegia hungarica]KAI9637210.1 hypothetical protein MKK02DRAFT_32104 [Dioszegia hungarica]